ncbi:hypothetical protein ABFY09_06705 [Marinomonas sp. 5E14-1]|uniref:arsenate reductase/protein-tyrosine-phosphatase family protein n=1 Tax=Marinomonas sp. 5E14-1 TaxID=3153922 RepID=UPI00326695A9
MLSILFICSGNTCRSPMAQAIAQSWSNKAFKTNQITVSSAGTHATPNSPISPEALVALARHNIPYEGKSQLLSAELLQEQDIIFVMTKEHLRHTQELIVQNKIAKNHTLLTLHPEQDIQDPLGKGQQPYDKIANEFMSLIPSQLQPHLTLLTESA